jgi:lipopolysaccharide transport system permease protein
MNLTRNESARVLELDAAPETATALQPELLPTASSLPDEPLVVIEASKSWVPLNLSDLWAYRELFYFLMWRDIKVRYKQTALGVVWAIIQPLATMIIFTLFFGRLAGVPSDGIPYPIFAFAGLLLWTFLSNAITSSSNSLLGDSRLITKVYFPRIIIPCASVGAGLVDLAIASVILVGLMFHYGVIITWSIVLLPLLVLLATLLALGVGMWMAAMNVKYRDVRYALPFLIQLWMFASPIIYSSSLIGKKWRWLYALNPLTGIIEAFRSSLFSRQVDWAALAVAATITVSLLIYSAYTFRRLERSFADIL